MDELGFCFCRWISEYRVWPGGIGGNACPVVMGIAVVLCTEFVYQWNVSLITIQGGVGAGVILKTSHHLITIDTISKLPRQNLGKHFAWENSSPMR